MGFDWKSFATGFMETTVETLEQRETEAKEFEREQRDAARRNAATIARRRAVADQVTGYANYLRSNGVTPSQIQAVIASGPRAIEDLTQRVQQAVRANGGRPLGASDVSTLISMPENFVASDLELSEYIDQTYGLSSGLQVEAPAAQQFSFMDRLFGRDQMTLAEGRVATTPFAEGMTIQQINDAALRGDYQSLIPGTFVSITSASAYNAADQGIDFTTAVSRRLAQLADSPAWIAAGQREDADEVRQRLKEDMLGGLVESYITQFGTAFLSDQEPYIRSVLGDEYVNALLEARANPPQREPATTTGGASGDGGEGAGGEEIDPVVRRTDTPLPEVTVTQPEVSTEAPSMVTPTTTPPPVAPRAEEVEIPEDANQLPEPAADATVTVEGGDSYTYEEWQGMTRTERVAAGLPTSQIGAQWYFNRFGAGIGGMPSLEKLVGPAGTGDPEQNAVYERYTNPQYENVLPVDDDTIFLLEEKGGDIYAYLQENQPQTEEELFRLLTQWGIETNTVMPMNKAPLVQVFRDIVLPQGQ
jgi:hypothetical protein